MMSKISGADPESQSGHGPPSILAMDFGPLIPTNKKIIVV